MPLPGIGFIRYARHIVSPQVQFVLLQRAVRVGEGRMPEDMSDLSESEAAQLLSKLEWDPPLITAHWHTLEDLIATCMQRTFEATKPKEKMTPAAIEYRARLLREGAGDWARSVPVPSSRITGTDLQSEFPPIEELGLDKPVIVASSSRPGFPRSSASSRTTATREPYSGV